MIEISDAAVHRFEHASGIGTHPDRTRAGLRAALPHLPVASGVTVDAALRERMAKEACEAWVCASHDTEWRAAVDAVLALVPRGWAGAPVVTREMLDLAMSAHYEAVGRHGNPTTLMLAALEAALAVAPRDGAKGEAAQESSGIYSFDRSALLSRAVNHPREAFEMAMGEIDRLQAENARVRADVKTVLEHLHLVEAENRRLVDASDPPPPRDPATMTGANGMRYGDRVEHLVTCKVGTAGEFTPDGDVDVRWDDGTRETIRWGLILPFRRAPASADARLEKIGKLCRWVGDLGAGEIAALHSLLSDLVGRVEKLEAPR